MIYLFNLCQEKGTQLSCILRQLLFIRNKEHVEGLSYWKKQIEMENLRLVRTSFCTLSVETECFNILVSSVQATLQCLKIQKQQRILEVLSWLGVLVLLSACLPTNITPFD